MACCAAGLRARRVGEPKWKRRPGSEGWCIEVAYVEAVEVRYLECVVFRAGSEFSFSFCGWILMRIVNARARAHVFVEIEISGGRKRGRGLSAAARRYVYLLPPLVLCRQYRT